MGCSGSAGMCWLSGDVVAMLRFGGFSGRVEDHDGFSGSVGDVVAQWECYDSLGNVKAQLARQ
jgi:hypothetical protein